MWPHGQRTSANEPTESRCQDPHHPSVVETNRLGLGKERTTVDHQAAREPDMGQVGQVQFADLIDTIERLRAQVEAIAVRQ